MAPSKRKTVQGEARISTRATRKGTLREFSNFKSVKSTTNVDLKSAKRTKKVQEVEIIKPEEEQLKAEILGNDKPVTVDITNSAIETKTLSIVDNNRTAILECEIKHESVTKGFSAVLEEVESEPQDIPSIIPGPKTEGNSSALQQATPPPSDQPSPKTRSKRKHADDDLETLLPVTNSRKKIKPLSSTKTKQSELSLPVITRPVQLSLPPVLSTIISTHSFLLTHLLLHYSTNALHAPSILSKLLPQLSKSVRKDIVINDLQRISALSNGVIQVVRTEQGLSVELVGDGILGRIENLRLEFTNNVRQWWDTNKTEGGGNHTDETIISLLPIAAIIEPAVAISSTLRQGGSNSPQTTAKVKTAKSLLLAKGQRRLFDLKQFPVSKSSSSLESVKKENVAPDARNTSLLDRIRAKAAAAAAAPEPESEESIQRTSALQSLENIIPILLQLTNSQKTSTSSFPMSTIISHVKNSFRNPIAAENIEKALRVLADEVASEWCRVVEWPGVSAGSKGVVGVVFERKEKKVVEGWKYKSGM